MTFLIAEMMICLLVAALIGFVAGWLLSRLYCRLERRRTEAALAARQRQDRAALEKGIDEARQRAARLDREMSTLRTQRDILKGQLDPVQQRVKLLEAELGPARDRIGQLEVELEPSRKRITELEGELISTANGWKERLGLETRTRESLETELASLQEGLEEYRLKDDAGQRHLEQELASAMAMCRAQQDELSSLREQLAEAAAEASRADQRLGLLATEVGPDRERLEGQLLEQRVRIAQLEADLAEVRRRSSTASASPTSPKEKPQRARQVIDLDATIERPRASMSQAKRPDDLKKIHGVGKVLEATLKTLGVLYFRQIASWNDADVARMNDQLGAFKGRIERDQWIEQARRLHRETHGDE